MSVERDGWKPHKTIPGGYTIQFRFGQTTEWIGHVIPCADRTRFAAIDTFSPRREYDTLRDAMQDVQERLSAFCGRELRRRFGDKP